MDQKYFDGSGRHQFNALDEGHNGQYFAPIRGDLSPRDEKSWQESLEIARQAVTGAIDNGIDYGNRSFRDVAGANPRINKMEFFERPGGSRYIKPYPKKN